jgi:hypothetical protein
MTNDTYDSSIVAFATITPKSVNQDNCNANSNKNSNTVIVADGLGSYLYAKEASSQVVNFLISNTSSLDISNNKNAVPNFPTIFKNVKSNLLEFADDFYKTNPKQDENNLGTTLLVTFENESKIIFSYVGNGGGWHIKGNFSEFPSNYLYPWNAINVLNPHTLPENGKEALYKLISDSDDFKESIPSVIEIHKDKDIGDIFMICTDGIFSSDQYKAGKNDRGIWVKYEHSMFKFFEYLNHFFKTCKHYSKEALTDILIQYLEDIKPQLDDDASIGIIITKETLNYQNRINWQKDEANTNN